MDLGGGVGHSAVTCSVFLGSDWRDRSHGRNLLVFPSSSSSSWRRRRRGKINEPTDGDVRYPDEIHFSGYSELWRLSLSRCVLLEPHLESLSGRVSLSLSLVATTTLAFPSSKGCCCCGGRRGVGYV